MYAHESKQLGAFEALKRRFVQLRFPIKLGISETEAYRNATRKGRFAEAEPFAPGLVLNRPAAVDLTVHAAIAGMIPVIVVPDRDDFVALVRAFSERNEPAAVPDSMGACIVTGFNNWDRVQAYRERWEREQGDKATEDAWADEFGNLIPRKSLYQDRFVILSRGPYSAVSARDVGFDEDAWLDKSLILRREHELTHYFTYRMFGAMRNNVLDELIADFVALVRVFGQYRGDLARRFLGLESFPPYRQGGRLEYYRGRPPLSDAAFDVLTRLTHQSIHNLEIFSQGCREQWVDLPGLARVTYALTGFSLEELASDRVLGINPGT
ncbi:MAG: hypothetical protein EXS36_14320 [Pedosphaera sp.]|nr:hypothetical protein [Pedosphaera sp.]